MISRELERTALKYKSHITSCAGNTFDSTLTVYASVNGPKRNGIFKYVITPNSFSSQKILDFSLLLWGTTEDLNLDQVFQKNYMFVFSNSRESEQFIIYADSIEELCDELNVSSYYDDLVICFTEFCSNNEYCPSVPLKVRD